MPALFIGHGSPMNAIEDNRWSRAFRAIGETLPKPRAVLAISAHWYLPRTLVTSNPRPRTIHDFGNFPKRLHEMQYPAPGSPDLAKRISALIAAAEPNADWGLDHGTWSVLVHLMPKADCPVVQLSIDSSRSGAEHVELGKALGPLRDEGVLVLASGNVTHNLRHAFASLQSGETHTPDWATRFDAEVARALEQRDASHLGGALDTELGRVAHPTPDHYWPLLYALGASDETDALSFPLEGFDASSLSMRAARFG
jgi:4,5-DOPA dioxygenase extradiol